mmetsp:Transcript_35377/g.47489  ORF Transcript_35377/g.47489 Transcript_35377/m.47489 type:complete len:81 (+) Transcript_35377:93-335(+)
MGQFNVLYSLKPKTLMGDKNCLSICMHIVRKKVDFSPHKHALLVNFPESTGGRKPLSILYLEDAKKEAQYFHEDCALDLF